MNGFFAAKVVWACLSFCGLFLIRKRRDEESVEAESDADPMIHLRQATTPQRKRRVFPAF